MTHLRKNFSACENLVKAQRGTTFQQNSEIQNLRKLMEVMTTQNSGVTESVEHQIKELEIKMADEIESQPIKEPTPEMMFAMVKSRIKNREEQTLSSMAFRITKLQTKKTRKLGATSSQ